MNPGVMQMSGQNHKDYKIQLFIDHVDSRVLRHLVAIKVTQLTKQKWLRREKTWNIVFS